jgi:hypothetical protein
MLIIVSLVKGCEVAEVGCVRRAKRQKSVRKRPRAIERIT